MNSYESDHFSRLAIVATDFCSECCSMIVPNREPLPLTESVPFEVQSRGVPAWRILKSFYARYIAERPH